MEDNHDDGSEKALRKYLGYIVMATAAFLIYGYGCVGITVLLSPANRDSLLKHGAFFFGMPSAIVVALVLVLLLRTVAGNIQIKGLGFEFTGASGPIIMWVLCFLSLIYAVVKTWPL
jgi:hypothetical protein